MGDLKIYEMPKFPKSPNIWQILQKPQFSGNSKKSYCKVDSLLYANCMVLSIETWNVSVYLQLFVLSLGKLQKVRNYGLKKHFWSPISSEQCFDINLKIWAEMVLEILRLNNSKIPWCFPVPSKSFLSRYFQE